MKKLFVLSGCAALLLCSGCSTEQMVKNLAEKSLFANGFVTHSKIGTDEKEVPVLETLFISGDFRTVRSGSNFADMRHQVSSSIWNASAKTHQLILTISSQDAATLAGTVNACAEILKNSSAAE